MSSIASNVNPRTLRYVIGGVLLLGLGAYNLITYTTVLSSQSTFNLLSSQAYDLSTTRSPQDSISGQFQETSGRPVSFYIETSSQFASFQTGTFIGSVYSIENVPSASIAFTFTAQDTYYLLFRHGAGLVNTTETVSFQRAYKIPSLVRLSLGLAFLAIAAADFYLALRSRKTPPTPSKQSPGLETNPPSTQPSTATKPPMWQMEKGDPWIGKNIPGRAVAGTVLAV